MGSARVRPDARSFCRVVVVCHSSFTALCPGITDLANGPRSVSKRRAPRFLGSASDACRRRGGAADVKKNEAHAFCRSPAAATRSTGSLWERRCGSPPPKHMKLHMKLPVKNETWLSALDRGASDLGQPFAAHATSRKNRARRPRPHPSHAHSRRGAAARAAQARQAQQRQGAAARLRRPRAAPGQGRARLRQRVEAGALRVPAGRAGTLELVCPNFALSFERRLSAVRRCKHMILNGFRPPRYVPAAPADVFDALLATAPAPARPVAAASPKQPAPSAEFRARVREPGGSFEAAPS